MDYRYTTSQAGRPPSGKGVISVSEPPPPDVTPGTPAEADAGLNRADAQIADRGRMSDMIVGHLTDQARRTASAAKARRVVETDGEPGVLDLTPLRELLAELMDELAQLRLRDRVAAALRQAADIIESPPPNG
jgi:hypothetical protein